MMNLLRKIDHIFVRISHIFLILTIITAVGMIVWQVICRFIIHLSVPYAEEFARLAIVWCILIGGALGVRSNEHIRVDSLVNILPRPIQFLLQLFSHVLVLCLAMVLIVYGWQYTLATSEDFTTSLSYCRNIFFVPTVFCGAIILIYTVVNIVLAVYNQIHRTSVHLE